LLELESHQGAKGVSLAPQGGRRLAVALDASALWLEAVEAVVGRLGIEVVAKATNCEQALVAVEEYQPQLFITDVTLASPDDGLDCIRRARAERPDLRVIVLSQCVDWDLINSAFALGAAAFVMKTAHADDLSTAVRQAFDPSVYFAGAAGQPAVRVVTPVAEEVYPREDVILTKREREILRLVAEGHSNAHLARLLWVAEQTVKFHLSNVYRKLGVSNRTEAARWAQVNGLLATPPSVPSVSSAGLAAG
jgi:DNA-binding NarL/FixJ family response regulator